MVQARAGASQGGQSRISLGSWPGAGVGGGGAAVPLARRPAESTGSRGCKDPHTGAPPSPAPRPPRAPSARGHGRRGCLVLTASLAPESLGTSRLHLGPGPPAACPSPARVVLGRPPPHPPDPTAWRAWGTQRNGHCRPAPRVPVQAGPAGAAWGAYWAAPALCPRLRGRGRGRWWRLWASHTWVGGILCPGGSSLDSLSPSALEPWTRSEAGHRPSGLWPRQGHPARQPPCYAKHVGWGAPSCPPRKRRLERSWPHRGAWGRRRGCL